MKLISRFKLVDHIIKVFTEHLGEYSGKSF